MLAELALELVPLSLRCPDPEEGWGPISHLREFDLTPCFEEGALLVPLFALLGVGDRAVVISIVDLLPARDVAHAHAIRTFNVFAARETGGERCMLGANTDIGKWADTNSSVAPSPSS